MVFYAPLKILSLYIELVSFGMVEEIGVPAENHQPLAKELTNFLILVSVQLELETRFERNLAPLTCA